MNQMRKVEVSQSVQLGMRPQLLSSEMDQEPEPTIEDSSLRAILEAVESEIGEKFFPSLVRQLATALQVRYAYVSELSEDGSHFRSCGGWGPNGFLPAFQVPPRGPCETVLTRRVIFHPDNLQSLYPHVRVIAEWAAESYCGVPIVDRTGNVMGHLAILDDKPMRDAMRMTALLGILAGRACIKFYSLHLCSGPDSTPRYPCWQGQSRDGANKI